MNGGANMGAALDAALSALGVEQLPDRLLTATDPTDVRFQYEVIRQLAESVRQQTGALGEMQRQQTQILERLARIEANRAHDDIERNRASIVELDKRVDALFRDKDRRDGQLTAWAWVQRSAPWATIAAAAAAAIAWFKNG